MTIQTGRKSSEGDPGTIPEPRSNNPLPCLALPDGRCDTACQRERPKGRLALAILRALYQRRLLYGWLCELRSFWYRTTAKPGLAVYRWGLDVGPVFQERESGGFQLCKQSLACIRDMQQVFAERPESLADLQLFLEGWDRGAEWGLSVPRNDSKT